MQMKDKGLIFDIRRYAVHDGPGIRTTVFFKGCPLHCLWCHNPEGISAEVAQVMRQRQLNGQIRSFSEKVGRWMSAEEVMDELIRDRMFYEESGGGVTFSGGEPLAQPGFLMDLLRKARQVGLHTAVDTSGYAPAGDFEAMATMAHCLLFDLKIIDNDKHLEYVGVDNGQILENLKAVPAPGPELYIRIPVIPGVNANIKEMEAIRDVLISTAAPVKRVDLLPYHKLGRHKYESLGMHWPGHFGEAPGKQSMDAFVKVFTVAGFTTKTGG